MTATTTPSSDDRGGPPWVAPGRRGRTAVVALAAAVLGAAVLAAILFATGAIHGARAPAAAQAATPAPAAGSGSLHPAALYAGTAPGVVDVVAQETTTVTGPLGPSRQPATSSGAGMILDRQGRILTADHVVRGASSVSVTLSNGMTRRARVVGSDPTTDLAVLSVNPSGLPLHPLALGDSAALQVGDPVAAIGDPFGYRRSMSVGIVSGLDRTIQGLTGFSVAHAVQTDAALDPGNSGGPLLDAAGNPIGIVDQIATGGSGSDSSTGVGFAISSNVAKAVLPDLERGVTPVHAYIGIDSAPAVGAGGGQGVDVQAVQPGGPAAKSGVRAGDVIQTVDGQPLRGVDDLIGIVAARRPGQTTTLGIVRGSRHLTIRVVLGTQPRTASNG